MKRRALLVSLGLLLLALGLGRAARAAPGQGPSLEISIIHATRSDAGLWIDPALRDLPQLTRDQPFTRHNVFKLLSRQLFPLQPSKPIVVALPNGRTLQVVLASVSLQGGEKRYQLEAQITDFLKDLHVTASENEPFFVGGQSYKGGQMYIELLIKP